MENQHESSRNVEGDLVTLKPDGGRSRPLSMAWISDELLAETQDVWSEAYGRPVGESEAVEILMNMKRFSEVLIRAARLNSKCSNA